MEERKQNIIYQGLDSHLLEQDKIREKYIHDLIINETIIQDDIMNILYIQDNSKIELLHEDTYINGITADFTVKHDNKIRAIIECKAGDIGVTDYVRGIGQVLQYEYFYEENISPKGYPYDDTFNTILLFPSSILKNNLLNIGRFKYPNSTIIIEINEQNNVTRSIQKSELKKIGAALDEGLVTISQYYIRDNRLFEVYLLLRYLSFLHLKGEQKIDRTKIEKNKLRVLKTPNNKNWRNAFISLSSLGLINSDNTPTPSGIRMSAYCYEDFLYMMYESYLAPYINELIEYLYIEGNSGKNNQKISSEIKSKYGGKDILFLTQSNGRYLSSWLNILRDDFGCIDFKPRNKHKTLNYNIATLNKKAILENIRKYSKAQPYLNNFNTLIDLG